MAIVAVVKVNAHSPYYTVRLVTFMRGYPFLGGCRGSLFVIFRVITDPLVWAPNNYFCTCVEIAPNAFSLKSVGKAISTELECKNNVSFAERKGRELHVDTCTIAQTGLL